MISDRVKKGNQKTNSRALMKAAGLTQTEIDRPFIGVAGSWTIATFKKDVSKKQQQTNADSPEEKHKQEPHELR